MTQQWRCPVCHLRITMHETFPVPVICHCGARMIQDDSNDDRKQFTLEHVSLLELHSRDILVITTPEGYDDKERDWLRGYILEVLEESGITDVDVLPLPFGSILTVMRKVSTE